MDRTGEYKLALLIGQRGFYAVVRLLAAPDPSSDSLKIEFASEFLRNRYVPQEFQGAIESGIEFAWKESRRVDASIHGLLVREVRLRYMVVDSTPKCVAYAAAGALLNALGLERLLPQFQPDKSWENIFDAPAKTE